MKHVVVVALALAGCQSAPPSATASAPSPAPSPAVWTRSAGIYEVNVRQYTPEGTFAALQRHLPRLRALGVDILWLMPVQPIGKVNRKGGLGSPYSVADYTAINGEYGTTADFRSFVDDAHRQGMRVILDWVANHTAFDHAWIAQHPDWYAHRADCTSRRNVFGIGNSVLNRNSLKKDVKQWKLYFFAMKMVIEH